MNEPELRQKAAELARECRAINKSGSWTIKGWNDSVRMTIRTFMSNVRTFHRANHVWEDQ